MQTSLLILTELVAALPASTNWAPVAAAALNIRTKRPIQKGDFDGTTARSIVLCLTIQ